MLNKRILVPTDFTGVADTAIIHATHTARAVDGEVWLLHIIEPGADRDVADEKLKVEADLVHSISPDTHVELLIREGTIFEDITRVGREIGAHLIFMGTHGLRGFKQFATGSLALKVVTGSSVPYVIVQDKPLEKGGYYNIVVPMGLHKDAKQKLVNVANIARYFNSTVHVITPDEKDEFLANTVKLNLKFTKHFFEEREIPYTVHVCKHGSGTKFATDIMDYASEIQADLICIMNHHESGILNILGPSLEQVLITNNAKIPVMLVNRKATSVGVGVFQN
ncbi:MAG TPA: universal stress protein [Luteibaculaceae bacterium]|jgi:nucleotide-binding universal stress UspA family protein|nr:universal stress protein [Luteibaculaceae bacterium]